VQRSRDSRVLIKWNATRGPLTRTLDGYKVLVWCKEALMSPEMELLDQLCGEDESLYLALQVFGWPEEPEALERARYSVIRQIKEGLIQIKKREASGERELAEWEARLVLSNDENWFKKRDTGEYYLSLTEKGGKYISG
jgi:hypothetical protein